MGRQKKLSGPEAFDDYYRSLFHERWDAISSSLEEERKGVAFEEGLTRPYSMDEASIIAAKALGVESGDDVLDMCAAPGGKTLVLASMLHGKGTLVSNDRSSARRARLKNVIESHIDPSFLSHIKITSYDSTKWGLYEQEAYDRVLLDAPCSSERHVIRDERALSLWSRARVRHLAIEQYAMLSSALLAVRIGGFILYSTCALTSEEDENVIEKLRVRREGRFSIVPLHIPLAEERDHGVIIMPDRSGGRGPLYFCLLRRVS